MRLRSTLSHLVVALLGLAAGLWLAGSDRGRDALEATRDAAVEQVVARRDLGIRERVLLEHPSILRAIRRGGGFGGAFRREVAQHMFSRRPDAIEAVREELEVREVAPRTWFLRMPLVNAALFETDDGLVLVDAGMAPAGPALAEAIARVSDAPLRIVVYTHGHVDHAFGTWALLEAGHRPEIVAHENLPRRFERYLRLRGSIARYMSQPEDELPRSRDDFVWPTRTFRDRLELELGGERFVLVHAPGETDDQLYVHVPARGIVYSADYYQGFLPNAGNGKRVQRFPEEWAAALRAIVALEPRLLLPAHGEAIEDPEAIRENLLAHAEALETIVRQTVDGLNRGLRKDQVPFTVELPPHLREHPALEERYVSARDISKMVVKRYTGWWDDLPSHWSPAPLEAQARALADLAGGVPRLVAAARDALARDLRIASHLADWAWLAAPDDPAVQQLVIDTYLARIEDPSSLTQEILVYIDAIAAARARQLADR